MGVIATPADSRTRDAYGSTDQSMKKPIRLSRIFESVDAPMFDASTVSRSSFTPLRRTMVGGGDPFYLKFWVNRPPLERNRRFSADIRSLAPQL